MLLIDRTIGSTLVNITVTYIDVIITVKVNVTIAAMSLIPIVILVTCMMKYAVSACLSWLVYGHFS